MAITLRTPTGTNFTANIDPINKTIVITSAKGNNFEYKLCSLRDLYLWLKDDCGGNWIYLGSRGEEETPKIGSVEEWARSAANPVGGFYGITKGRRGRFSSFVPSILEHFGFVEIEHKKKNNRVKAIYRLSVP